MDKQNNQPIQGSQQPVDRTGSSGQNEPVKQDTRDISNIDRKEGDMDNGELGGNFREEKEGSHKNSK